MTTPESLALQLSYEDAGSRFRALGSIVVDEWHELLGSKRGVLLELGLARLRQVAPTTRIWGLSATIGNLEEAMLALLGPSRPSHLIAVRAPRRILIETALPPHIERFAWAGHLGLSQLGRPHPSRYVLAGHLHPGATLRDGKLAHRHPAFWIGPRRCLLPAYGLLTGLAPSSPEKNDRVAILTPGGVLMKRAHW